MVDVSSKAKLDLVKPKYWGMGWTLGAKVRLTLQVTFPQDASGLHPFCGE